MALATLSIDLVAKVASFEADLKRVARTAEQQGDRMAAAFGLAKSALGGLAAGLSVGAAVAFLRNIVDGVDALNDLADATGASIENLSGLEDVAARTGTSFETVGSALVKLNKALADAKPGSDAAAAFDALGLSVKELKNVDPAEALRLTAVALSRFADDGNKARLTQELFGKSLREVAPLLKDLAESGTLNATVTTEQAKAAEAFNKELFKLQKNVADVARDLAGPMVEAITKTIEAFRNGAREGKGFFETLRGEQLKLLGFGDLATEVTNLQAQLAIEPKGTGLFVELEKQLAEKTKLLETSQKAATAAFRPSQNFGDRFRPSAPAIGGDKVVGAKNDKKVAPLIDPATTDAIKALEGTDTAKIAKLNAQLTELFTLRRETKGAPGVVEAITSTREELEKLDPAAVAAAKAQAELNAVLAGTPSAQIAELVRLEAQLTVELAKATDPERVNQLNEALGQTGEKLREIAAKGKPALDELSKAAERAGQDIEFALGDTLESALSGNFKSIGELWKNLLVRMAAQAAASQIIQGLLGLLGTGFSGASGSVTGGTGNASGVPFFQAANGAWFDGNRANFARGGVFSSPRRFSFANGGSFGLGLMAEAGPEAIMPLARDSSGRLGVRQSGPAQAQGPVYNINVNGDATPATARMIEDALARYDQRRRRLG